MTLDSHSAERPHVSGSGSPKPAIVIVARGESPELSDGQEKFISHTDFWLTDGNLILIAGDTAFRVYQGLLTRNSAVFADMFATAAADVTEMFDGCPVVRLPQVHPDDLRDFLQYLMPCSELRLRDGLPVSDFSELHAAIHLAHKYQCSSVETRALSVLKQYYTPHFVEYTRYSTSRPRMLRPPRDVAITAVNIARLTDTPSVLPFALYRVCTLEDQMKYRYRRRDGSVEHLSADDFRLCVGSRDTLAKVMEVLVDAVFNTRPSSRCKIAEQCMRALRDIFDNVELNALYECDVLDSYEDAIANWAAGFKLCRICEKAMLARELAQRRRVWKLLPGVFGMTVEECGFTTGAESSW
ncbi:hypothetical protein GSI_12263 [Ganoderma sinense ZZ0214-1]|uniref:BTB domain-containing protein n=1 Tax=Ganoderma sinense ZZ0214-1 TaxID=1077348 RepID=A0A2G8RYC3_9APHY|nr:hypothetical protein GSI_12263 [Ganoderma sinense ZZ0214-1]